MMHNFDIKRYALIMAVCAEIEGMKAEIEIGKNGCAHRLYRCSDFDKKAKELRELAYETQRSGRRIYCSFANHSLDSIYSTYEKANTRVNEIKKEYPNMEGVYVLHREME